MTSPPSPPPPPGFGPPPPPHAFSQQPPAPAPEFLAVDRDYSILVDSAGVAFDDHGLSVDFGWHEIRSVHYKAGPSGKTLMVAVIHVDGTFYECAVDAKRRERVQEWFAQLAFVLGYYRPRG
ncbi:hypothetical protein [Streptomyces sp. NPDC006668]|uniref:hypothetical protein n=1 Tax=Streptomyces sp. NPDC006668 TaxID=3156903 RepID=UPI0033F96E8E